MTNDMRKLMESINGITAEDFTEIVAEEAADTTHLDLSGLQGLEVNRLVGSLEKLGLEQAVHYFIKSNHPSWILNKVLDQSVLELLQSYGVEELEESVDEDESVLSEAYDETVAELVDIYERMHDLLSEAEQLLSGTSEYQSAKSYWLAHIAMALDDDHGYLGKSMQTMKGTIEALEANDDEHDENLGQDDDDDDDFEDDGSWAAAARANEL